MRTLRPYQQQAINSVRNLWRQGKQSTVLVAPTGAGKTAVAEEFIRLTLASGRARVYFLAHATELVAQPLDRLRRSGFRVGAIKAGLPADPEALVQVGDYDKCQPQGLARLSSEPGRTVLDFWDRTVDSRGGSHSLFILPPGLDFAEAVRVARLHFPDIWARLDAAGVVVRLG